MPTEKRHKIIITGTGRAGTTLLVELFTELGLDTGYTRATFQRDYHEHCKAGLERDVQDPAGPRIVKNPELCETLPAVLAHGEIAIDFAVIPVRHLDSAARSRIRIGGTGRIPGGLHGTSDPLRQKAVLAENFHQLVETLTAHDIPHAFLHFPRFVQDPHYTYGKLRPILGDISYDHFEQCFQRVAKPELVHVFAEPKPADAGAPAKAFKRSSWRKRVQRRVERTAGFLACFGLGCLAPWSMASKAPVAADVSSSVVHGADIAWLKQSFSFPSRPPMPGDGSLRRPFGGRRASPDGGRFFLGRPFPGPMGMVSFRFSPARFLPANFLRVDPDFAAEKAFLGAELFMR